MIIMIVYVTCTENNELQHAEIFSINSKMLQHTNYSLNLTLSCLSCTKMECNYCSLTKLVDIWPWRRNIPEWISHRNRMGSLELNFAFVLSSFSSSSFFLASSGFYGPEFSNCWLC